VRAALPLVLGGALGNLVDRLAHGYVIDFIDVHVSLLGREYHWPTFNVADAAITVGVALLALDLVPRRPAPAAAAVPRDDGPA
jgi:signal peptidase II